MECPFCDFPLEEITNFSEDETNLIGNLPYVIAYPLRRAISETHAWTRINLLKDTFLNYLKYLGLLSASEFFNSPFRDRNMVALFQHALSEPSFGSWNQYIREMLNYFRERNHFLFCADLPAYYEMVETGKKRKLYRGEIQYIDSNGDVQLKKQEATAIGMLINFRNRYLGHGLTLDENASKQLWDEYFPIFRDLLLQMTFSEQYPMFKHEHGETYLLKSAELQKVEKGSQSPARVWIENPSGESMDILPFFVVPGEVSLGKETKEQLLAYESYTGKTVKFFSPEGTEKQTSGKILERINLLLRQKLKEEPCTPENFSKELFKARVEAENKLVYDTLIAEKKIIPGIYVNRVAMETKLREWIGARANIFFIAAEAGSGKTNLLAEIQRQYSARDLPCILIRAGRMEKPTLRKQLAYILNISEHAELFEYTAISGTQDDPTFLLLDGLNESNNAEAIWAEVLEFSRQFPYGSFKFIITSRANSKADNQRYLLENDNELFVYGEKKEHEAGLNAYAYWLSPLNMLEMKGAWETYEKSDKSKFKPRFSFDDLATFDRGLYDQLSNPLVLRLFLETYHGKGLPRMGGNYLNIWHDWLETFSADEQIFLTLLADVIWEQGKNELLLDDLLKDEKLRPYFNTDLINAPYPRLKNNGWVSRYSKDLNACVSFTVEGALLYLLGLRLKKEEPALAELDLRQMLKNGSKLQQSAVEEMLCQHSVVGDLTLVSQLIDAGEDYIQPCIKPLLLHLKSYGVSPTIEKVLAESTENDWKALFQLDKRLEILEMHIIRKEFLTNLMKWNQFQSKDAVWLGLKACSILNNEITEEFTKQLFPILENLSADKDLLHEFGKMEFNKGNYDNALDYFQRSLRIKLETLGGEHPDVADSYNSLGVVWDEKGEYDKALEHYEMSIKIRIMNFGTVHLKVATAYNNIGVAWYNKGFFDKALEYFEKSLAIRLETLGSEHPDTADSYNNIGEFWNDNGNYEKAMEFYEQSLNMRLSTLGGEHPDVSDSYFNIGEVWCNRGFYETALEFFDRSLKTRFVVLGEVHPSIAKLHNKIGSIYEIIGDNKEAINSYINSYNINKNILIANKIAVCFVKIDDKINALKYYLQSAEIGKEDQEIGVADDLVLEAINNAKKIAIQIQQEKLIPQWIKNLKL
jgi:tetratricopeptide (TPR) repeat protein